MLCRQEDFAPLTDEPWNVGRVCGAIARIVADVDEAFRRQPLWPAPSDSPVEPGRPEPSLYAGAPGVVWALDALAQRGRTGDELWLERARRFAVHALAQAEREAPLYSLWLGAIGVAVFASDCLDASCRYPVLG